MKKILWGLLCLCMLLSGCRTDAPQPVQTAPPETNPPTAETQPVNTRQPLLEQGISLEESSNLLYIPNEAVASMTAPEMRLLGHGLLLSECTENEIILKHISLEDGALVASATIPAGSDAKLSIGSGEIGLYDRESGLISILDESFRLQKTYEVTCEGDDWYLNSELDTLYIFFADRGLLARNLETGEERWLVDNGFRVMPKSSSSGYLIFEYTDRTDQKTYTRCLNLSTATLETLPIGSAVSSAIRQGEVWLLQDNEFKEHYTLVKAESAQSFTRADSMVRLLSPRHHLLVSDPSGRNLVLYESRGDFLSRCALPQSSHATVGADFVWSGYWEGYFFLDFIDSSCRLMFWDVGAAAEGDNLQMSLSGTAQQPQPVVESQLYERAAQLSQRFGVDIRIAEQCSLDYTHYDSYALTDPVFIREALDILEESLGLYPEGFFRQLTYGSIESIRIELVGGLMLKPDVTTHTDSAGAFVQNRGSYYTIVANGFLLQPQTLFHEFSHIIDDRLDWDSFIREDALYSEEAWLNLQPEGFSYAMSYTNVPEELLSYLETDYFISDYSLTYPTEDRATLLASAMENNSWNFEPGSGRAAKLRYYADCIRGCFDTTGWPTVTLWEQVLQE